LPLLRFAQSAPVYFDRHTLSLKGNILSMFTLDGRMHFALRLAQTDQTRFHREKLLEVMLMRSTAGFDLVFEFAGPDRAEPRILAKGMVPPHVLVQPPKAMIAPPQSTRNSLSHDVPDPPTPR